MDRHLLTAAQVRQLETGLADRHGLTPETLMQRAGQALHDELRRHWPDARRVLVLAGAGNNGGDGYVLARLLRAEACQVTVVALAPAGAEPAASQARAWREAGGEIVDWSESGGALPAADVIVDALFGIGLARPLEGVAAALIQACNQAGAPVLAVDVASGLDADTGAVATVAVHAQRTLCLLARKRGLYTGQAADHVGSIGFDDLACTGLIAGFVDQLEANVPAPSLLAAAELAHWLPARRRSAHKGDHGHVLIIGGDIGMGGAVRIAGTAALRAGAGWCSVATRQEHAGVLAPDRPELMVHGIEDGEALAGLIARASVIALGPGLGRGDWSRRLLDRCLSQASADGKPLLLDADALNLLADGAIDTSTENWRPGTAVLTPHPGEAARLLGVTVAAIEADRYAAVRELARRYRCVAVLKGAGTLVDDGRQCRVCAHGNPGMASAGMGDALSGIIAALLGQGLAPFDAASAGVLAHALAGDHAAGAGERGLLAADLIDCLRHVVNP
ncbi:MAG: NAD(P)H-hydrate dehydratase [Xanthomonadales bacterium]|nr:NAD(P)H-hydrate dehydratase [Xanthomonadales bacterium]